LPYPNPEIAMKTLLATVLAGSFLLSSVVASAEDKAPAAAGEKGAAKDKKAAKKDEKAAKEGAKKDEKKDEKKEEKAAGGW